MPGARGRPGPPGPAGANGPSYMLLPMTNNGSLGAAVTAYIGGGVGSSATEADKEIVIAAPMSYTRLSVRTSNNAPAGTASNLTLRKNGVDTGIVLAIAGGSVAGVYTVVGAAVAFAVGDRLSIKCVAGSGGTPNFASGMLA